MLQPHHQHTKIHVMHMCVFASSIAVYHWQSKKHPLFYLFSNFKEISNILLSSLSFVDILPSIFIKINKNHYYNLLVVKDSHEFHESCHSVTFIVMVNSHQRWKQMRKRVCFHLWCELTLALWCHSIVWSLFSWNKM